MFFMEEYDVAIVGAGPAGLMAAVYAGRYKLNTIVFGELFGGTISEAHMVCNFPTYCNISGMDISQKMVDQVINLGIEIAMERIESITKKENYFVLKSHNREIKAKKVIISIGRKRRHLGIERELELKGKGVSYCATCDGPFYKNKVIAIVGGSDAALSSAVFMADIAKKVYIVYRGAKYQKAEPVWIELVKKNPKIESVFNSNIVEFLGKETIQGIRLDTGQELNVGGVFIEIGSEPQNDFIKSIGLKTDDFGYVVVDSKMRTSIKGIFSAGDLNSDNFKQAVVAAAEGAIAANTAFEEIKRESVEK